MTKKGQKVEISEAKEVKDILSRFVEFSAKTKIPLFAVVFYDWNDNSLKHFILYPHLLSFVTLKVAQENPEEFLSKSTEELIEQVCQKVKEITNSIRIIYKSYLENEEIDTLNLNELRNGIKQSIEKMKEEIKHKTGQMFAM